MDTLQIYNWKFFSRLSATSVDVGKSLEVRKLPFLIILTSECFYESYHF